MKKRIAWALSFILAGNLMSSMVTAEEQLTEFAPYEIYSESQDSLGEENEISVEEFEEYNDQEEVDADVSTDETIVDSDEEMSDENADEIIDESGELDLEDDDGWNSSAELLMSEEPEEEIYTGGQCGDDVYWAWEDAIDDWDHTALVIYGTGNMWDYSAEKKPEWEKLSFVEVYFQGEVTSVGDYAFYQNADLQYVTVNSPIASVGSHAFAECTNLWDMYFDNTIQTIGESAYENCDLLFDPLFSENMISVGAHAFAGNNRIDSVTFEGNDTEIGEGAFSGCREGFTIYCNAGSKAEAYAKANGIPYSSVRTDIGDCDISLSEDSFVYDGNAKTPTVTVKNGDIVLEENEDYTVEYISNVDAGTGSAVIFGKCNYYGVEFVLFTIEKAKGVITASDKTLTVNTSKDQSFSIGAKVNSQGKLTYKSDKTDVTVNSSGKVVVKKGFVGTATITINAAATDNYTAAKKTIKVVVNKMDNVITAKGKTMYGNYEKAQYYSINATAKGKAKITYASDNKNITVDSTGKVTVKKNYTGIAIITMNSAATKYYNAAKKRIRIVVNRKNNTITASNQTVNATNGGARTIALNAKALGGAKLTYSSDNANITVDSTGKVTVKKSYSGSAKITIRSSLTNVYNETVKTITVTVNKVANKITAENKSVYVNVKGVTQIALNAKAGGGAILTYSSDNRYISVNSSGVVSIAKGYSGTAKITITSSATSVYKTTSKVITVSAAKRNNTISASGRSIYASESITQSFNLNARVNGGARLSYRSSSSYVHVDSAGKVYVSRGYSGTATITITSTETAEYKAASKQVLITVQKQNQTFSLKPTNWSYSATGLKYQAQKFEIIPLQYKGTISVKSLTPAYVQVYNDKGHHMVLVKKGTPKGTYIVQVTASGNSVYNQAIKQVKIKVF